jgi:hypothetical protein
MLLAASVLADCAPEDNQQRALARYTFLYADALLEWARRWRNQLKHDSATRARAQAAKPAVQELATALDTADGVRDYLAAKRQPVQAMRADDIEATAALWIAVNPHTVQAICAAAIRAYDELNEARDQSDSLVQLLGLPSAMREEVRAALPSRDHDYWYLAADTAADLRPHTLPAAQGGNLGRLIAQINDVAGHLDVLLRIAPVVHAAPIYDWLVRSAMLVELNALLDLTLGPPPSHGRNVMYPLVDLCRLGRPKAVADDLDRLRASIGCEGWDHVRSLRNTIGAHVDNNLTMFRVHEQLIELDYQGVIKLAEHVLDFLDTLGATQLDLSLLLFGERKIKSWPTDPSRPAPGIPSQPMMPGVLARLFRSIDSPYMSGTGSTMGSAVLAGMTSARKPEPRAKITVPSRLDHLLNPVPRRLHTGLG